MRHPNIPLDTLFTLLPPVFPLPSMRPLQGVREVALATSKGPLHSTSVPFLLSSLFFSLFRLYLPPGIRSPMEHRPRYIRVDVRFVSFSPGFFLKLGFASPVPWRTHTPPADVPLGNSALTSFPKLFLVRLRLGSTVFLLYEI